MGKPKRNRPNFGRKKSERGLDQFDTPPIALPPLFIHETLPAGVTTRLPAVLRQRQPRDCDAALWN